jgi:trigger factor
METGTSEIQVTIADAGAWSRRLTITVPAERIERERRQTTERLSRQARIPGFRKGKVPRSVMEKRFGQAIEQETVEKVMSDAYRQALEQEKLQPISQGSIDNIEYKSGEALTFHVEFEVRPEIELNQVGGFEITRPAVQVGDDEVDAVLDRLRDEQAEWDVVAERPLAGDMASVEITPLDDAFAEQVGADRQPRHYQVVLGEGQALPAIEDVIRTLEPGQEGDFTVDLPVDAEQPETGTRQHLMHVKLQENKRPRRPELTDEFAAKLGDFPDVATLRERIAADMQAEAEREAERTMRFELLQRIIEANPFDVPDSMVEQYLERAMPAKEGIDIDRLNEARQQARPAAEHAIRRLLIIERIAELEGLHATPAEIDERISGIAERLNRDLAEVRAQLQKNGRLHEFEQEITEEKVFSYLMSLSTVR